MFYSRLMHIGVARFGLAFAALLVPSVNAADLRLVDFSTVQSGGLLALTDSQVTNIQSSWGSVLRVATGHRESWPGVILKAPDGRWDLTAFAQVVAAVRNPGSKTVTINCRVDNPGADGTSHCITRSVTVGAGATNVLRVDLRRASDSTMGGKLFGLRGYPVASGGQGTIDPANITQILVFVNEPQTDLVFEVGEFHATGRYTPPTAWVSDADPSFPFIDALGQYRHKAWPGKTPSPASLASQREAEARSLARAPGIRGWNRYGGWAAGPQLDATGFFRVQKHGGKWWLVDPEGRLFWSHGMDCVRMLDATPIDERADWFADFPGDQGGFAEFITSAYALKGHYAERSPQCFSFAGANLKRKYGAEWREVYPDVVHQRLRAWGLNTIANWSDEGIRLMRRTPYTDTIGSSRVRRIEGSEGYWGKFPDVFDPAFREGLRRQMASKAGKSAGDPWCIGYFSDNEMGWGDDVSLATGALASPADQPAKRALLDDLRAKYGEIGKLNAAWGSSHESWDALAASPAKADRQKAGGDLRAFYTKAAERYFSTIREVIREVAPNQLYLGCRFAWGNDRAAAAAAKFCDVVSYNLYQRSVADFRFNGDADVPLIIGEFHFGALDRGLFHTGLVPVGSQAERARAYQDYARGALRHPQFVGCHWFQYQDEPTIGRVLDEENYQIGFVDIADTPYAETVSASRTVAETMYALRLGD